MQILNWINGKECQPTNTGWIEKFNPHTGTVLSLVADSTASDT